MGEPGIRGKLGRKVRWAAASNMRKGSTDLTKCKIISYGTRAVLGPKGAAPKFVAALLHYPPTEEEEPTLCQKTKSQG